MTQRADVRDRLPSSVTPYSEPRGQYGDVSGQYRERYYPEAGSRGPAPVRYSQSTQDAPVGLNTPPWNKIPGESSSVMYTGWSRKQPPRSCYMQLFIVGAYTHSHKP